MTAAKPKNMKEALNLIELQQSKINHLQTENDELFVDVSTDRLPVIVAKYMGRNDFRHKEICDSLPGFSLLVYYWELFYRRPLFGFWLKS